MNSLSYLISYLCEYFKGKKHTITPFQKQFNDIDKHPKTSVLYFGYFNIDDVLLENKFLNSVFSANKNTPVFFTNIQDNQDITNLNFIGWKVDFEIPIFVNVLQINNFRHLQGGNPPRITFDTNFDSNLTFYGQVNGVPFSYDLGFLPASPQQFFNNNYFDNDIPMVSIGVEDYPCFIKDKISSQIFQFDSDWPLYLSPS